MGKAVCRRVQVCIGNFTEAAVHGDPVGIETGRSLEAGRYGCAERDVVN